MNRSSRALNFFSLLALLAIVLGLTGCYSDSSAADDLWTKNIHAVADAIYNVGSSTARYLNGWFVNLHADNVTSNNVTTGELWVSGNTSIHTSDNTAFSFQGPVGPAGPPGPAGTNGHTILSGTGAPGSGLGSDGDYYLDTSTEDLYGPKSGTWGSPTSLIGAAGANGLTLLNGSGAPSPATGVDGDFYIDTTAHTLYGPKSGTWGSATSLVGPAGAKGDSGAAGQGYNDRGAWVSGLSYAPYDTTTNAGSTYECTSGIINSTTAPGSDSTHFQVWAAKGDSGATGDPGSTGPAGPNSVSTSTTSSLTANKIVITDGTGHLASDNNTYLTTDDDSGLVPYTGATSSGCRRGHNAHGSRLSHSLRRRGSLWIEDMRFHTFPDTP